MGGFDADAKFPLWVTVANRIREKLLEYGLELHWYLLVSHADNEKFRIRILQLSFRVHLSAENSDLQISPLLWLTHIGLCKRANAGCQLVQLFLRVNAGPEERCVFRIHCCGR